jgi:endonuclease VIII
MPEGDTIHRIAGRMNAALAGQPIELAEAPNPRSPMHRRAEALTGRTLQRAEARGKHLLAHFSGDLVVHSHLGMSGRLRVVTDGGRPRGRPWLVLAAGRAVASQSGGKVLRLVSESRARNDPGLAQLGPDPLAPGFDLADAAAGLLRLGAGREVGDAILDQRIIAGLGNAIRIEAGFAAGISPWRLVDQLEPDEAERLLRETYRVMRAALETGHRPRTLRDGHGRCPRCGGRVLSRGQGDANRIAYWCPRCQV